jgi:hypothetical protein
MNDNIFVVINVINHFSFQISNDDDLNNPYLFYKHDITFVYEN